MPRARKSWKAYERIVMSALGGRRIPVTGRAGPGGDPGDGELPGHYVEIRDHARPRPIRWFREVAAEARSRGVIPLLIFKGPSSALSPLVLLRLHDLEEVIHRGGSTRGAGPDPAGQAGDSTTGRCTVNLLQILEKVIGSLPGIILGVETVMHGLSGTAKKDEALKGVGEVLDGIVATGTQIAKDTFLTVASDMIDV